MELLDKIELPAFTFNPQTLKIEDYNEVFESFIAKRNLSVEKKSLTQLFSLSKKIINLLNDECFSSVTDMVFINTELKNKYVLELRKIYIGLKAKYYGTISDAHKPIVYNYHYVKAHDLLSGNSFYKKLFESSTVGMLIMNDELQIVKINKEAAKKINLDEHNCGVSFGDVFRCSNTVVNESNCGTTEECEKCSLRRGLLRAVANGEAEQGIEFNLKLMSSGREMNTWFMVDILPIIYNIDTYYLVTFSDITEHKMEKKN